MAAIRGVTLKNISKVKVVFATFDTRMSAARDVYRRLSATTVKETNPKCPVSIDLSEDKAHPAVEVTFSDGATERYDAMKLKSLEIIELINRKSRTL